ncbi:MAG TPA: isochorismatase family cysteine hydrolase [Candidatus Binatia bacterium]|nr:isochorismatase family cysteine hydrolase [Candidatus Binatia bacterium]
MDAKEIIELSPEHSGLVIVDMQIEGCERHGPGVKPVIQHISVLLDRFRRANGKIIHIQSVRPKDHPEFTFFGKAYSLIEDSPAVEFIEELKPYPGEVIVKKYSHDCFYQTALEDELKKFDLRPCRDHIVVTGIGSNNCVYHAVIGLHIRNYFVHVPEDCIHASRAEGQQFAISQFRSPAYNFNVSVGRSENIALSTNVVKAAANL